MVHAPRKRTGKFWLAVAIASFSLVSHGSAAAFAAAPASAGTPTSESAALGDVAAQLLHELESGSLQPSVASAVYASHAARGLAATDRRWWVISVANNRSRSASAAAKPLDPVRELTPTWRDAWRAVEQAPASTVDVATGFRRVRRGGAAAVLRRAAVIETHHFVIETATTADSWPAIVETCETTAATIGSLLDLPALSPAPMRVVVAKNREEYIRLLGGAERRIAVTSGYFDPETGIVYCYWDGRDDTIAALRHEVTHQLLTNAWTGGSDTSWRTRPDFWAYEAVAAYAESIRIVGGVDELLLTAGGWDAPRLQAARYRRLHDLQWVEWPDLRAANAETFQAATDLQLRYSQSAALAHMFFDAPPTAGGAPDAFEQLLEAVHRGRPASQILDLDSEAVRRDYDRFLQVNPDSLTRYPLLPPRVDVVLSRCEVSPEPLLTWPTSHRRLDWLDLSFTQAGGSWLGPDWSIRRLNLESNPLTESDIDAIVSVQSLEELDVSDCGLDASAVARLCQLPNLRRLWLSGNPVGDEVLEPLSAARRLEHVDVQRTDISPTAWQSFLREHPRLR